MEYLQIDEILPNPFQPRREFPAEEMALLAKSIKEYGIIEPLIVRINTRDKFELVAGERRLRAAQMAGLHEVPVILKDYDDRKTAQIAPRNLAPPRIVLTFALSRPRHSETLTINYQPLPP